jgi:arylsulfatase A-like enzyme
MDRRGVLKRLLAAPLAAGALWEMGCSPPGPQTPRVDGPNIVLVTLDTVRADHLGAYGYSRPVSPRFDRFAAEAALYTKHYVSAPWTVPTHGSMFTGKYPFAHGARSFDSDVPDTANVYPLDESQTTLAEALRDVLGYETAGFVANAAFLHPRYQLDQGFQKWAVRSVLARELNPEIFNWLDKRGDAPFFLFVNYMDAHWPYNTEPRPGFLDDLAERDSKKSVLALREEVLPAKGPIPEELTQTCIDQYDLSIANVDDALGALLDKLREMGVYDNTVIVLLSDHGEYFGEHHLVLHSKDIYQEALWTPLAVKGTGPPREGSLNDEIISSIDIPHLILSELDPEIARLAMALFPAAPGNHPVLAENYYTRMADLIHEVWGHRFKRVRTAIFDPPFKFIHSSDGRHELYDLEEDPKEQDNLAARKPEVAERLLAEIEAYKASASVAAPTKANSALSPEEIETLKSLGYL